MLQARVKQLEKEACEDTRHRESLLARLVPLVRKEVAEKEAAKETTEEEVTEKEVTKKEVVEKEDKDNEEDQAWPSRSSDDDGPVSPIRFPRVKR
jgi:hypothetical protein